jgi:hypothetical protein
MSKYQCCFCGKTIKPISPDVCSILFMVDYESSSGMGSHEQQFWCHALCFKNCCHKSAPLYVLDLAKGKGSKSGC